MLVKIGIAAALSLGFVNGDTVGDRQEMQHLTGFQNGQDVVSAASLLSENVVDKDDNDRRRMLWGKYYYGSKYSWSKFSSKGRDSSSSDGKRSKRDSSDSNDSSDNRKKSSKSRDSSSSDDNGKSGSKRDSSSSSDGKRSSKSDDSSSNDGKRSKRGSSSDSSDDKRSKRGSSSSSSDSSRGGKGGKGGRGSSRDSSDSSDGKRSKRKGSRSGSSSESSDGRKGSKGSKRSKGSSSSSSDGSKGKKVSRPTARPTPKPTPKPTAKPTEADCETSVYLGRVWSRTNLDTNEFYDYSGWYHLVENDHEAYWRRDDHSYVLKMELFDNKNYLVLGDSYDTTGSSKIYYYLDASEWNRYENPITTHKADENDEWFCLTQDDEDYYYSKGKYSKHGKHSKSKKSKSKSKSSKSGGNSGANCKVSTGVFNVLDCNNEDRDFCDWDNKLSYFPKFLRCQFSDKKCGLMNRMFGKC